MISSRLAHRLCVALIGLSLLGVSHSALAQARELDKAREYFRAGAQAYAVGEFATAIQAFEQAYALVPRPAVLFSIAQAERRRYATTRDRGHLEHAIEMYRSYLENDPKGSRKQDALQALAELEPLLTVEAPTAQTPPTSSQPTALPPTRILISSPIPGAKLAFDREPPRSFPLIREVEPGEHRIFVSAPGYVSQTRKLVAVRGGLVTLDVTLEEQPAHLDVRGPSGAELRIDGRPLGELPLLAPLELRAGPHSITVAKRGFVGLTREETLERGKTTVVRVSMPRSTQRTISLIMLGAGASAITAGGVFYYFVLDQEAAAEEFLDARGNSRLTPEDLEQYNSSRTDRNQLRQAANISVLTGAALGLGGLILYVTDGMPVRRWLTPRPTVTSTTHAEARSTLAPWVGHDSAGMGFSRSF